jgi:hypothetical protein
MDITGLFPLQICIWIRGPITQNDMADAPSNKGIPTSASTAAGPPATKYGFRPAFCE